MKNYIFKIAFALSVFGIIAIIPSISSANITFSPVSPQGIYTAIDINCSVGDFFSIVKPNGSIMQPVGLPCLEENEPNVFTPYSWGSLYIGAYKFVECNSQVEGSQCDTSAETLDDLEGEVGYVSTSSFVSTNNISNSGCLTWVNTTTINLCDLHTIAEIPTPSGEYSIDLYKGSYPNNQNVISHDGGANYGGSIIEYQLGDPELHNGNYNITISFTDHPEWKMYANFVKNVNQLDYLASGGLFFYRGIDQNEKINSANDLVAMAGSATQASFGSLGSVLAVVGAIILAFVVIRYIISLIYETNSKKENRHKI